MKIKGILFVCLLFAILSAYAEKVDPEKAEKVAQGFVQSKQGLRTKPYMQLKYTATNRKEQRGKIRRVAPQSPPDTAYYYVFNTTDGGFVIVAADDAVRPVLGYSVNGNYDENNLPPNFAYWMDCLQQQIAYVLKNNLPQTVTVRNEWETYLNGNISLLTETVGPLIQTQWNQGHPYYIFCPILPDGYPAATGCVATAMAQIMNYHQFPDSGSGESDPYITSFGIFMPSASLEVKYDWENMLNIYSDDDSDSPQQQNAVATLMYHCGLSLKMNYGLGGSGAFSENVVTALTTHFGYDRNMQFFSRMSFQEDDIAWVEMLKAQIYAGLPVYYEGGAHAFICDGYNTDGTFHFNWGSGGWFDGYYVMDELYPGGSNQNIAQQIIINIKPVHGWLNDLTVSEGTLSPAFRPFVFDYTVQVDASVENIDIAGMTDIAGATVTGNTTGLPLKLNDFTDVTITVTDNNGDSQTYTITVIRGNISPLSFTYDTYSAGQEVILILEVRYGELCIIDWGDASPFETITGVSSFAYLSHTYQAPGAYQVIIQGGDGLDCPVVRLNNKPFEHADYRVTQVDLRAASMLKYVDFADTENRDLDVSQNKRLTSLLWTNGKLRSLDVSNNKILKHLECNNNAIPLINLYALAQSEHVMYKNLGLQTLPDSTGLPNISIAIDTVFHGVNTVFEVDTDAANYTLNDGAIRFSAEGIYTVDVSNAAILDGIVRQTFYVGRILLNKNETSIYIDATERLIAKSGIPGNTSFTWSSSDTNIATVDSEGLVTGIATGTAIITATTQDGNYSADCEITVVYNASLKSLSVISNDEQPVGLVLPFPFHLDLIPYFREDITEYTVYAPTWVLAVDITGEASHAGATVTGNVTDLPVNVGKNISEITVTAADGVTTRTYTITIVRNASFDATLKSLTVSSGELFPAFAANETDYTVNVENSVTGITVTGVASHRYATIEGNVTDKTLLVGANKIPITVTAENGVAANIYTVTVFREEPVTGIDDSFAHELKIYPNPFTGEIHITGADVETGRAPSLQIINAAGLAVYALMITNHNETIRLAHLPPGVYFFRVEKDGKEKTVKVVKK